MTTTIKAFGRAFETSSAGMLLDQAGRETRFKTMDIEINHAAVPPNTHFSEMEPGDSVAFYEPTHINTMSGSIASHVYTLLIREGRLVTYRKPHEGVMYD